MRLAIARLMSRSKPEIPHYYVSNTVDLGVALSWLRERNRSVPMSARMVPAGAAGGRAGRPRVPGRLLPRTSSRLRARAGARLGAD